MTDEILRIEDLTKRYGRSVVVDQLSLSIERGDIFGFLGQNGAGKSTVIRMALGLVRPTQGRILLFGHDMARHPLRALGRVGAMVESPAFYDNFSGWDNIRMFAAMSGGTNSKRASEVLDLVNLTDRAKDPVRTYSHGMRQRLGIAQALLPNPEFVILDEPTDGLDPQGIREIRLLLPRLRDELGLTILFSSHLLNEVEQVCNAVAIIDHGRLLYHGPTNELLASENTIRITAHPLEAAFQLLNREPRLSVRRNGSHSLYVTLRHETVHQVNALLVANNIQVSELAPYRPTLEDVFMKLCQNPDASG